MPTVNDNELVLAIRMRELCRPPTAWNRSIWSVSALTALREVLEASAVRRDGILSDASLSNLQHTTAILLGKDPGVGDQKQRKYLSGALSGKSVITPGSLAAATIDQAATDLEANYLPRWADAISAGVSDSVLEQCARCVVRIHHASASQGLKPVELIARAELRVALLDQTQPESLISILD